ncbi:hypothetical protein GCM10008955_10170 [Deinococcus malanensis]|uniref:Fibronectin type-III domain-containing protein n=1 Tax=Deinococcus malanensis TaxID=1706855 RepID=A0ABQ2ERN1_9DEIO|nr:fibronectin type III domain-containing protein [Deinococcus malanensis]GGK18706.1 hypothetical protein GCM10008955_10170 [Deinococcus malanensis]
MGQVDTSVTANVPNYAVFKKGTTRTYAAYNPTASPITVTFSDGATLSVPARQVVSSRGSASNTCSADTAAPTTPGAVSSPSQSSSSVTLSWGAASDNCGVSAYEVYMNAALKATVSGTGTTISGLGADTAYLFKVRARDALGNLSPFTSEISVRTQTGGTTAASLPGTVTTNAGAIASGTSKTFPVNVNSTGTYRLSVQSTSSLNSLLINVAFAGSNYDLAVDAGQTAIADFLNVPAGSGGIVITAKSDSVSIGQISGTNLSAPSDPCATDTTAPSTPTNLTAPSRSSSSVTLSWTASTDNCAVSGYDVYMNGALKSTVSGAGATVSGLNAVTTYAFKVRARDAKGNVSAFTGDLNVTTASAAIPVPGVISSSVGAIANGASRTFDLNVTAASNLRFLITNASTSASTALTVSFNGRSVPLSIGAGQTIPVDFAGVQAGIRPLTITANSAGVALGKLEAVTY